jgi:hypothetical protein
LKGKFGQVYQVEMKVNLVSPEEEDYKANAVALTTTVDSTMALYNQGW